MFKKRFEYLKSEIETIKKFIEDDEAELAELKENYAEFLEWKKMKTANEEAAAKMGHFYISADDVAMLEKFIQVVNKDPDLAVLMTTPQGTTMSLRSHPQPKQSIKVTNYNKFNEEE